MLKRLGAVVEGADEFEAGELPDPLDPQALALGGNWVLLTRLGRLDLMQRLGDAPLWEELSPSAVEEKLKELAARPEDLADLKRLREARGDLP